MRPAHAQFAIGEPVRHLKFDYRGVIFDTDPVFCESDEWYGTLARRRPPQDRPWYRMLVDGERYITHVAERNRAGDEDPAEISHPLIGELFGGSAAGLCLPRTSDG